MRNPDRTSFPSSVRTLRGSAVVVLTSVTLLAGQGTAAAVQAEPNAMTFGLLGPVGLVAVIVGVLGMAAGVLRQRRRNRLASVVEPEPPAPVEVSHEATVVSAGATAD